MEKLNKQRGSKNKDGSGTEKLEKYEVKFKCERES